MSATIIDGTAIGKKIREELKAEVAAMKERGVVPGLSVVLVGEDPASQVYVRMKGKAADELGMKSETIRLPAETPEAELLALLDRLNADPKVHGILVQLPLPKHMDAGKVLLRMTPEKDVTGSTLSTSGSWSSATVPASGRARRWACRSCSSGAAWIRRGST